MAHRNAPLTETGRFFTSHAVSWTTAGPYLAVEGFQVSHTTAARWAARCRTLGIAGMSDRASRAPPAPTDRARDRGIRCAAAARAPDRTATAGRRMRHRALDRLPHPDPPPPPPLATLDRATASPFVATNGHAPANWSASTSRDSDGSPMAAATRPSAGPEAAATRPAPAGPVSTPSSTTTPAPPTPKAPRRDRTHLRRLPHPRRRLVRIPGITVERVLIGSAWGLHQERLAPGLP